ncbi:MAG: NADPH-dependent glutamate synthase [Clostridia bacterium]|nr:NADPH-dependent glutamate synthase [Clostridia bacterium]
MAFEKKPRNVMPEQAPEVRAHNFEEVALGFTEAQIKDEASRCMHCKNAPCMQGCPVSVNIPDFLAAAARGDFAVAGEIIGKTSSLPAICGRVCPQETQCEKMCLRGKVDGAVAIGQCERFVGDYMLAHKTEKRKPVPTGKRVAVIGSGPAGLTCAAELSNHGVQVTIFEAFHKAGGVLVYGIPEFRLPKALVQSEIEKLCGGGNVEIKLNTVAGKTRTMEEIAHEYDAVFIGSGAGLPMFMNIPGENLNGVYSANEYLTRVNLMKAYLPNSATPVQIGKNVSVIGAGNVAMDAARTALRMGAQTVRIVYRRGREEMPARAEEIHHAEQEGIEFLLLTNPVSFGGENGWVKSMRCVKMALGEPDKSGRRSPAPIAGSEYDVETDMVIVALGTRPNPLIKNSFAALKTNEKGTIVVDEETMQTSVENMYAGGDAVTGAATVILAMGAGRKASKAILEKLGIRT